MVDEIEEAIRDGDYASLANDCEQLVGTIQLILRDAKVFSPAYNDELAKHAGAVLNCIAADIKTIAFAMDDLRNIVKEYAYQKI